MTEWRHTTEEPKPMNDHPDVTREDGGFAHFRPVPSTYGGHIEVVECSDAVAPHVFLFVECPSNLNDPTSPTVKASAHLTLDDAGRLAEQLRWLVANHYQVRPFTEERPAQLDLSDPKVRAMVNRNHQPREHWTVTGELEAVSCEQCGKTWPCEPVHRLRGLKIELAYARFGPITQPGASDG